MRRYNVFLFAFLYCYLYTSLAGSSDGDCSMDLYEYSDNLCQVVQLLQVEYSNNVGKIEKCGELKSFTDEAPSRVYFEGADMNKYYTLLMVDPDAPDSKTHSKRYWLHWIVTNIKGEDLTAGSKSGIKGDTTIGYMPPSPPTGSGDHRYQFFLFKHDGKIELLDYGEERGCFCVKGFVENSNLGNPVAATEFKTRND